MGVAIKTNCQAITIIMEQVILKLELIAVRIVGQIHLQATSFKEGDKEEQQPELTPKHSLELNHHMEKLLQLCHSSNIWK